MYIYIERETPSKHWDYKPANWKAYLGSKSFWKPVLVKTSRVSLTRFGLHYTRVWEQLLSDTLKLTLLGSCSSEYLVEEKEKEKV